MTVELIEDRFVLSPVCPVEDAEALLEGIQAHPAAAVDLTGCTHLHTAVVQVLLAARPRVVGEPASAFLTRWVLPLLQADGDAGAIARPSGRDAATPPQPVSAIGE